MKKDENKIYTKPQYKCAICNEIYDDVQDRMNCEMKCIAKQKEEEKKAAEAKKRAEKDMRKKEVDEALRKFANLVQAYAEDYGSYKIDEETIPNAFWPNKFWHHFWF